jgi:hypothetical protein
MRRKFQIGIYFKTLLKAKRRISFRGSFYLVKGKAFETRGGISNPKNASYSHIPIPLTICKSVLNRFPKDLQKQNVWCKCGPKYQKPNHSLLFIWLKYFQLV